MLPPRTAKRGVRTPLRAFFSVFVGTCLITAILANAVKTSDPMASESAVFVAAKSPLDDAATGDFLDVLLDPVEATRSALAMGMSVGDAEMLAAALTCEPIGTTVSTNENDEAGLTASNSNPSWRLYLRNDQGGNQQWLQRYAAGAIKRLDEAAAKWSASMEASKEQWNDRYTAVENRLVQLKQNRESRIQGSPQEQASKMVRARPISASISQERALVQTAAERLHQATLKYAELSNELKKAESKYTPSNERYLRIKEDLAACRNVLLDARADWQRELQSQASQAEKDSSIANARLESRIQDAALHAADLATIEQAIGDAEIELRLMENQRAKAASAQMPAFLSAGYTVYATGNKDFAWDSGTNGKVFSLNKSKGVAAVGTTCALMLALAAMQTLASSATNATSEPSVRLLGSLPGSLSGPLATAAKLRLAALSCLSVYLSFCEATILLVLCGSGIAAGYAFCFHAGSFNTTWNDYFAGHGGLIEQIRLWRF